VQLLLNGCNRHDALVGILEMETRLFRLHGPRLEQKNAGDNLKAIGDAVLHFLEQNLLGLKQIVLFSIGLATTSHVLHCQQNGAGRTILIKYSAGVEQHHAAADRWELVLDLMGLDGAALRDDVFEQLGMFHCPSPSSNTSCPSVFRGVTAKVR
jgi:hypothetical protein